MTAPLEILEAGTGHGSLTLHLARAIHGANPAPLYLPPPLPSEKDASSSLKPEEEAAWAEWKASRRAIIHTLDISDSFSRHAQKLIRQFRRGVYLPHIDFHVAPIKDWIVKEIERRSSRFGRFLKPFLSYVLLDMPSAHLQIDNVAPAMREDALLAVFAPSITQIGDCVKIIQGQKLPFVMDRVVELGTGISSGRLWDVRLAQRRSTTNGPRKEVQNDTVAQGTGDEPTAEVKEVAGTDAAEAVASDESDSGMNAVSDEPVLVCRPKVGERIVGGGFVGIWRRVRNEE